MPLHHWSTVNPELELELERDPRRDPRRPLPLEVLEANDTRIGAAQNRAFLEAWNHMRATQVRADYYQRALEFAGELEAEAPRLLDHGNVRLAIADYLEHEVIPDARRTGDALEASEYGVICQKLRLARPSGAYGVDVETEQLRKKWANRAGLVKLCPSDARDEAQRASKLYGHRIAELDEKGYVLRSAVFTMPNFPQWHLGAGMDAIFDRFKQQILYARVDGKIARSIHNRKRTFPDLVGAWACLEAPLSRLYRVDPLNAWNVHVNFILVFRPSELAHGMPDYGPLNEAWGAGIRWRVIPQGDRDAMRHAILELVKYPLQTVAEKSAERGRAADGGEKGPPMIAWPAPFFREWWRAHKGFRRMRSWGMLYRGSLPPLEERSDRYVDWLGGVHVDLAKQQVYVQRPILSTVEQWEEQRKRDFAHRALMSTHPRYARTIERREHEARERERAIRAVEAARERLFLIQGNKFAGGSAPTVSSTLRARDGPPIGASASSETELEGA